MKAKLTALFSLIRIRHWWYSKMPMYLGLGLMLGLDYYSFKQNIIYLSFLFAWLIGGAAFGYFLNDCFDIEEDKAAGKPNLSEKLAPQDRLILLVILASISVLPWLIAGRVYLLIIVLFQLSIFMLYSIKPIRLKDRLYMGIIADSLYAYLIPSVLILVLYKRNYPDSIYTSTIAIPLMIWALVTGTRAILYHHLDDRKKDASSVVGNVVNKFGLKPNIIVLNTLLLLEIGSFCTFYIHPPFAVVKALILFSYAIILFVTFNRFGLRISFTKKIKTGKIAFFNFYEKWLLFIISVFAIYTDWRYTIVLVVFIALFMVNTLMVRLYYLIVNFYYKVIVNIYIYILLRSYYFIRYKIIIPAIYILVFDLIRPPLSYIVNHAIYYFRIWVLGLNDKEARSRTTYLPFISSLSMKPQSIQSDYEKHSANTRIRLHNSKLDFLPGAITPDNKIVNGLWIGNWLSKIELLTIKSFLQNGHEFHLWVYEPIKNPLPDGVIVKDANEIIDASKIFRYKYTNHFGHGKGSVSGFSDIFRYKLLYEKGGWWTDMDMTCLRPLNIASPYFFRSHHELFLVGNVMKVPKGSVLMSLCYKEACETIDENNRDWHKPIEILNKYVDQLDLDKYVISGYSNEDKWDEVRLYAKGKVNIPANYMVLHWMNEEWRSRKMDKDDLRSTSTLAREMIKYKIMQMPKNKKELWANELRHLLYIPLIE